MRLLLLCLLPTLCAGCDFPRDVNGTLDRVHGGTVRAGLVEHPPWATRTGAGPAGVDVRLIEALADELGAEVSWTWGTLPELLGALEHRELDVVAGGVPREFAAAHGVGYTRTYYVDSVMVGAPGGGPMGPLRGTRVAAVPGSRAAAAVRKAGGVPVAPEPGVAPEAAAMPAWRLEGHGLRPTEHLLTRDRRVFAVPAGENGWLVRIERFLEAHRGAGVGRMLRAGDP